METAQKSGLLAAGIDVDEAMGRFLGNETLFLKFLVRFPQDENYGKLQAAVEEEDWQTAVNAAHTLKGVCGNLSITPLYQLFTRQVDTFRAGDPQGAAAMMGEIAAQFDLVARAIQSLGNHGC